MPLLPERQPAGGRPRRANRARARAVATVGQSAQPPADWSVQRLIPRRRCALPVPLIPATPLPPREGAPSIASLLEVSGFAAPAAGPLWPFHSPCQVLQCTAAGLLRQARPRCAHQQHGHRSLDASAGKRACQAGLSTGGRSAGVGGRTVWGQRAPTPLVRRCAPRVGRAVFYSPGCVPADRDAWKASHGRGGLAGGRRSGAAPLACLWPLRFSVLERRRTVISARSCVKARPRSARCCAALTPAPSDWLRSVRTANTNCSDQPRIGQGSVAHVLAHPLFGGHGKPSHPCVSLQHKPSEKCLGRGLLFLFGKPHTPGRCS